MLPADMSACGWACELAWWVLGRRAAAQGVAVAPAAVVAARLLLLHGRVVLMALLRCRQSHA